MVDHRSTSLPECQPTEYQTPEPCLSCSHRTTTGLGLGFVPFHGSQLSEEAEFFLRKSSEIFFNENM